MLETGIVWENCPENSRGDGGLDGTVRLGNQVGRGEVNFAVSRIGRWRYRRCVGRPHGGCRGVRLEEMRASVGRLKQNLFVGAADPLLAQLGQVRALVWRENPLNQPEVGHGLRIGQPLQCGLARAADGLRIGD